MTGNWETTETRPLTGTVVSNVLFAVPTHYTIGRCHPTWKSAVRHALSTIKGTTYPSQKLRRPEEYSLAAHFHPKRYYQVGDDLLIHSRAFVQMRVVEPIQDRPGSPVRHGSDSVVMSWEVFHDGTVEAML